MFIRSNYKTKRKKEYNNRLHIVMAIIFLLVGAVIFRLFDLQVMKYEYYSALASSQHQAYNELAAERGKIFIKDTSKTDKDKLYPLATNKDFAMVYAVPKDIDKPDEIAEKLYEIFDKNLVVEEVDKILAADEFFSSSTDNLSPKEIAERNEFKKIKKDLEIENRKKQIIDKYVAILGKKNDPYEPLKRKVDEETLKKLTALNLKGINYIMERHRYYPEKNNGAHIVGFVGYVGDKLGGRYGLEGFFEEELSGKNGFVKADRSASGDLIIINDREYEKPIDGSDLVLTIDRAIQYMSCEALRKSAIRHGADGGTVIVMEPKSGAILAMCSWPDYDPNNYADEKDINVFNNPAIFDSYEPGSVFKTITMAAAINENKVTPKTTYIDKGEVMIEGWPKPIRNSDFESHGGHGKVDMTTVLEKSLNTGIIFAMNKIGAEKFAEYVKNFGFGEKTGIELETEGLSNIKNLERRHIRPIEAATAAFGQGIQVTPLQMIVAYAAIANGGILPKPYLVDKIVSADGVVNKTEPQQVRRVISERTSLFLSGMLVNVVDGGHAKHAAVNGYYVAGKTGTAQVADKGGYSDRTIHTFIGFAPVENPRFVMLVKLDDPKDVRYAASSAAPLFGKIAEFILNYYQVPKER